MWTRGVTGIILCLAGLVWILQGTDVLRGSQLMSGHGQYAVLGIVVLAVGAVLLVWADRIRRGRRGGSDS